MSEMTAVITPPSMKSSVPYDNAIAATRTLTCQHPLEELALHMEALKPSLHVFAWILDLRVHCIAKNSLMRISDLFLTMVKLFETCLRRIFHADIPPALLSLLGPSRSSREAASLLSSPCLDSELVDAQMTVSEYILEFNMELLDDGADIYCMGRF